MGPDFKDPGIASIFPKLGAARLGFGMVHFNDIVAPDALGTALSVNGKKQLFQKVATLAAQAYGLEADMVAEALLESEKLGAAGFGGGVAIPHAKVPGLQKRSRGVVVLNRKRGV